MSDYISDFLDLTNPEFDVSGHRCEYDYDKYDDDGKFDEDGLTDLEPWWWVLRMSMMYTGRWMAK